MKYSKKRAEIIVNCLKNLKSKTEASRTAEISTVTFYEWYNTNPEFKMLVDKAIDEGLEATKYDAIDAIKSQFNKNWTSAAWWLERKYPEEYSRRDKLDTNVNINAIQIKYIIPEEPKQLENIEDVDIIKLNLPDDGNN